jgi:hypothetical protein
VIPVHSLKFGGNDFFKRVFVDDKKPTTGQRMLAGTCAGLLQQTLTMPLEVVRTRLSLGAAMNPPLQYRGILGCAGTIVRMEGWMGLYKGLVATLWSGVPFVALQMTLFGVSFFLNRTALQRHPWFPLPCQAKVQSHSTMQGKFTPRFGGKAGIRVFYSFVPYGMMGRRCLTTFPSNGTA